MGFGGESSLECETTLGGEVGQCASAAARWDERRAAAATSSRYAQFLVPILKILVFDRVISKTWHTSAHFRKFERYDQIVTVIRRTR